MAAELTFEAICTASRNPAAFVVDRSRILKYAGRLAQLCSSARLTDPAIAERLRPLLQELACDSGRDAVAVTSPLRGAALDARESTRDRKANPDNPEEERQETTTYDWTRPSRAERVAASAAARGAGYSS